MRNLTGTKGMNKTEKILSFDDNKNKSISSFPVEEKKEILSILKQYKKRKNHINIYIQDTAFTENGKLSKNYFYLMNKDGKSTVDWWSFLKKREEELKIINKFNEIKKSS